MTRRREWIKGIAAAVGFGLLILDSKTALTGAKEGLELCIATVIPSLIPFIFLSILLTSTMIGRRIPFLQPLCRLYRIPSGTESLLIAGFLGGYPVGAQCLNQAYASRQVTNRDARRMLAFCNNCGPAFLFGMSAGLFDQWWMPWVLWLIHIISALLVACCIPAGFRTAENGQDSSPITISQGLDRAIRVMTSICGWVLVFRILIAILQRWLFLRLPQVLQITIIGLLELSNGCIELYKIGNPGMRFLLCSLLLGFGGLCVTMQTFSVTQKLDRKLYFPGKLVQCCISFLLSYAVHTICFPIGQRADIHLSIPAIILGISVGGILILRKNQKSSRIIQSVGV